MKKVTLLLLFVMSGFFAMANNGHSQLQNNRETFTYDFDGGTTQGWTNIDADGDGYIWVSSMNPGVYHNSGVDLLGTGHNGSDAYMLSGSFSNQLMTPLTPDNYFVSPQVALGGTITFFACGQDADYAAEHFGVAVSTTINNNASAFTTIQEWTLTAKSVGAPTAYTRSGSRTQGNWYQFTASLSAFAGQTGYVAIRHFNVSDEFILNIDDITIIEGNGDSGNYTITATADPIEGGTVSMNNYVVFNDDFENGIANWTTIDADGDGYTWYDLIDDNPNNILGHNSSWGFATSASYMGEALTPDDYLVSPHLALNGTFSFWANAQDAAWPAEHFGVAVSTTSGTEASAFSTIQEWTLTAKATSGVFTSDTRDGRTREQGAWYLYSVDLSSYNGQMGYIAIRHFNVTDMFRMNVDDVELRTSTSSSTVTGVFANGQSCTVTATPTPNSCFIFQNWTENGEVVSTDPVYTFTVEGNRDLVANFGLRKYTITATPDPEEGGTITMNSAERDGLTYDFEDSSWQGWTTIDGGDPTGYGWQLISSKLGTGYGHEGSLDGVLSQSYDNNYGVIYPDNYLISPQITLGGSISFWACGQDASYAAEHFGVAVSTTDNTSASSFTTIQEWTIGAKGVRYDGPRGNRDQSTWTLYTADLSAYSGQGYVAIRHFNCSDMYFLDVDDITIVEGENGGGDPVDPGDEDGNFNCGETCILIATPAVDYDFVNWTEDGVEVSDNPVYYFTVDSSRDLVAHFVIKDGVGENNSIEIALYPNPVNDMLNVVTSEDIDNLEVYDITGALVYSNSNCTNKVEINTSAFATGSYFIRLTTQSVTEIRKFVKL